MWNWGTIRWASGSGEGLNLPFGCEYKLESSVRGMCCGDTDRPGRMISKATGGLSVMRGFSGRKDELQLTCCCSTAEWSIQADKIVTAARG
jgi:hypothetical protein